MRSARRRKLIEKKKKAGRLSGILFKFLLPIIFILAVSVLVKFTTKYWNGEDKLAVAYRLDSNDVAVSVFDPRLTEITTLVIPGDTQVDVARNYGELRIKNVWQLGVNEKIKGALLAETITQNFLFPVFLWSDGDIETLFETNTFGILKFVFFPGSTNISFGDRVSIGIFAMKTGPTGKNLLNLGKNQFLIKQRLNDGEVGYVVSGDVSQRLTAYFADNSFADNANSGKSLRVAIVDATSVPGVADTVGQIIEVMGGKIVSIDKRNGENNDCTIYGTNAKAIKKFAILFSCKTTKNNSNFDIEISLGQAFAKRF